MLRAFVALLVISTAVLGGRAVWSEESAASSKPTAERIQRWMGQLTDDSFAVREEASRRLLEAGLAAKPALSKCVDDPDPELRKRARKILAGIDDREDARIITAFLAEKDPKKDHGMRGWKPFRDAMGDSLEMRKLYVEAYKAETGLLRAFEDDDEKKVNEIFAKRMNEIIQSFQNPVVVVGGFGGVARQIPLGNAAAMLFAAGDPKVNLTNMNTYYLIYQSEVNQMLQSGKAGGEHGEALRKIVGRYVGREIDGSGAVQNFSLAVRYELPEALGPALKYLPKEGASANYKCYALMVVAKYGQAKHTDAAAPLLADKTQIYQRRTTKRVNGKSVITTTMTTQTHDVALAAMILVNGGDLRDFGYTSVPTSKTAYYPHMLGFADDTQRDAAKQKYDAWIKGKAKKK